MKKILIGLAVTMLAGAASASVLLTDTFSYTGSLTNNGWTAYSGADGTITANGSVAAVGSGAEDIRSTAFADQLTGTTYASFVLRMVSAPASGNAYAFGLSDATLMESRYGLVGEASSMFGVAIFGGGTAVLGTVSNLSYATDYLITMGYNATTFTHSLWVNSDGTDFATPDLSYVNGVNTGIDGFFIRQAAPFGAAGASYTVDNLLVASTFAEAIPAIPEPATMSLLGLGALAMVLRRKMKK